jgi:predicted amidohydrolase
VHTLDITLIQTELFWENKEVNIHHFTELIDDIKEQTDVIILPEMCATGFSMKAQQLAESMDGAVVEWMKQMAHKKQSVICGSLIIEENSNYYNRFIWVEPDGKLQWYDKRHLFRMTGEHDFYKRGEKKIIIEYKGFKIFPIVCYDLRFPVWLRRTKKTDYDLLIVVANWPERRVSHWKTLIQARAIENQVYVAAVNRVGTDGNGFIYSGETSLVNPKGEILFQQANESVSKTLTINSEDVIEWRKAFNAIEDADNFVIE